MTLIYSAPEWFFNYAVTLELFFAIISLVIALFSYKLFRITNQHQSKLLGSSFFMISMAYFIQSAFNLAIVSKFNQTISTALGFQSISIFDLFGVYTHIIFMIAGFAVLSYMTFGVENKMLLAFIITVSIIPLFFGKDIYLMYYLISTIYLAFIFLYFIRNYFEKKQPLTLMIPIAFLFLLFGSAHYFISVDHSMFYVISHFLELVAYLLILINFYLVLKK